MSIIIFSRPIHSGKTTELLQWCNQQKNISGILMPDINGSRKILNIKTKEFFDIECTDAENTKESLTTIGKYNFFTAAFEKANLILLDAVKQNPDWLVIDEVGKLELEGSGFHPAVKNIIKTIGYKNLLLVVRDSLCESIVSHYKIYQYSIMHQLSDLP